MTKDKTVDYLVEDGVGIITLNRPQARNSFNKALRADLGAAIDRANADKNIRVVMICGAGQGFSAGADLAESDISGAVDGAIERQLHEEYHPFLQAIEHSKKPYISVVNGAAAGIGASLALACDLTIMAEDAFLYSAFGAISLIPDGGFHWMLNKYLSPKKAFEMIAESQRLSAQQCEQLGIANRVVAADKLLLEGLAWAKTLASKAPLTLQHSKYILRQVATSSLAESRALEAQIQDKLVQSDDFKEGAAAFFEKRSPVFTGK